MDKPIAVNFYAGPGTGKSGQAGILFGNLKKWRYSVEYVQEYAKDLVWQESLKVLANQLYVFGKQYHRMNRLDKKVDVIVTDSPLLQNLAYAGHMSPTYFNLVEEVVNDYYNINIVLRRGQSYDEAGRTQSLEQAKGLDEQIDSLIDKYGQLIHGVVQMREDPEDYTAEMEILTIVRRELAAVGCLPNQPNR